MSKIITPRFITWLKSKSELFDAYHKLFELFFIHQDILKHKILPSLERTVKIPDLL